MTCSMFFPKHTQKKKKTNLSLSRKGQLEVSFNWIFVIIAGGVILAFFIMVTKNEKQSSFETTSKTLSVKMESLLSSIQQNPDAVQTQDNLNIELQFRCGEDGHTYSVKDSKSTEYLESQILFTPKIVGDSKTIAWTQLYYSPYPVVYALYFTDEKTKYIFLDEGISREYYSKLPDLFIKEKMTLAQINNLEDQGFRKYIIVAGSSEQLDYNNLRNSIKSKTTIVSISPLSNIVKFNDGQIKNSVTINDATLFGAIISGDYELYGCVMEKLMRNSRIVGEVNLERVNKLQEEIEPGSKCSNFFLLGFPEPPLKSYIRAIIGNSTYQGNGDVDLLKESMENLQALNREIARANCPTVY